MATTVGKTSFPKELGASETRILGSHVCPPSSEALKRTHQPRLSGLSRRSCHETPTTPSLLTATTGMKSSGPACCPRKARSSFTVTGLDHVFPLSVEYASKISTRPDLRSGHTAYSRSLN